MKTKPPHCPLSDADCREDCAWADIVTTIDEDGMTREVLCAVAVMASAFVEDEDDGW